MARRGIHHGVWSFHAIERRGVCAVGCAGGCGDLFGLSPNALVTKPLSEEAICEHFGLLSAAGAPSPSFNAIETAVAAPAVAQASTGPANATTIAPPDSSEAKGELRGLCG